MELIVPQVSGFRVEIVQKVEKLFREQLAGLAFLGRWETSAGNVILEALLTGIINKPM